MPGHSRVALVAVALTLALAAGALPARADGLRHFPGRPVAWAEHDDLHVPGRPAANRVARLFATMVLRDSLANEIDRVLALETRRPAEDVNAADEVPCSTWFCARNHLTPLSIDELLAGPSEASPPRPPLRIVAGKDEGITPGFEVVDAAGTRMLLKLDPRGHLGMVTGSELVAQRIFHAAGYNVPGAFRVDITDGDLTVDPHATFRLYGVEKRPLTQARVAALLAGAARLPDGRLRAVAVPWIRGDVLGPYDVIGRRKGDPNDRIPHEHRRSLRANWVLFNWLSVLDPGANNTLDSYVAEGGRRFVRHYIIDFGASFGSANTHLQGLHSNAERTLEVGRTLASLVLLGFYQRPFQEERREWEDFVTRYPAIGHYPAETYDPDEYRSTITLPTHVRMTARDAYWGAKLVTSFSDAQLTALVDAAGIPGRDAQYLAHALRIRRDIIGRRYMRAVTATERPEVSADGGSVCFTDLAVQRGYAHPREVRHATVVTDGLGRRLASTTVHPDDNGRACVAFAASGTSGRGPQNGTGGGDATPYRIVELRATFEETTATPAGADPKATRAARASKTARVHLRFRNGERRFVVVGLERDD